MQDASLTKLRPFYLMRILLEQTDEDHPLSLKEICALLAEKGISADRKTIYDDMSQLAVYGLVIEKKRSKTWKYYVAERPFELAELKMLVDVVQSSRFISEKKSRALIAKLASLTSIHQAEQLQRSVFITDQPKAANESILYSIDALHVAVSKRQQISFRYFDYDIDGGREYRKDGDVYLREPLALCWKNDSYYLIARCPKAHFPWLDRL